MTATPKPRRLRVLQIVQNLNYGGAERLVFEMLRRSDPSRFDNHVLILQYAGRFGAGLDAHASVSFASPMSALSMLRPLSLARDIAAIRPDVVHTHSGVWYKAARAARLAGVPWLVHTDHGRAVPDPWLSRALDGAASRHTDVVVAVSDSIANQLRNAVVRWPARVRVVANGVDVSAFHPRPDDGGLCTELGIPRAPIIGSIGRLEPIKGYEVMVDAYAALRTKWQGGDVPTLVIAGDGSERAALEARAEAAGVADGVRWLGWRDDIHRLHAAFTLFTMSSHSEGTSVSLLEAMSAGLCPVTTNVGGNAAVMGASLQHRLVPPRDPESLAVAWIAALRRPDALEADGRTARARVMEKYTLDAMVRAYELIYLRDDSIPADRYA